MLRDTVQKIIYQCTIHNYTPLHITTCWHWVKESQFSLAKQLLKVIIHGSTVLHEFLLESGNIEFGGRGWFLLHKISFKNYCPTFRQLFTKYFSHRILQCTADRTDSFTENISLHRKTHHYSYHYMHWKANLIKMLCTKEYMSSELQLTPISERRNNKHTCKQPINTFTQQNSSIYT